MTELISSGKSLTARKVGLFDFFRVSIDSAVPEYNVLYVCRKCLKSAVFHADQSISVGNSRRIKHEKPLRM